ncbi:MAG: hypothetical protein CMJ85_00065 [Planctomycetes bacterium]|nr:hypothetical protein [Planctomycetota bacterium]
MYAQPCLFLLALVFAPALPSQSDLHTTPAKVKVLLVSGANNHDWKWTTPSLERILQETGRFDVTVTYEPAKTLADAAKIARFDVFLLDYNGKRWGERAESNFMKAVRGGTGVSVIHAADNAFGGWVEYEAMVGHLWRKGTGHGRFHPFDVEITDRDHPVTAGMNDLVMHPDELYHRLLHMHEAEFRLLGHAMSTKKSGGTGKYEPMIIVKDHGKGRVFHTPLGHVWRGAVKAAHLDPQFRQLVARGTEWAATGSVLLAPYPPNYLNSREKKAGWKLLFDGKSTEHWRGYKKDTFPAKGWVVEDGCLVHKERGGGGDIITRDKFRSFELAFEWAVGKKSNSGVMYLVTEEGGATYHTGPEFQVIDDGPRATDGKHSAGSLYGLVKPTGKILRPLGMWNTARIVLRGRHVQHWVNGVKVVDTTMTGPEWDRTVAKTKFKKWPLFAKASEGHIALQDHGNLVSYRSIRIRELDDGQAPGADKRDRRSAKLIRVGIIGLDTSHAPAFTKLMNKKDATGPLAGVRVVAAFPGGSPDIPASRDRIARFTKQVRGLGAEIVNDIPALLDRVDAVMLESVDGRPHWRQAEPVLRARKPIFIDKPLAGSLADAGRIFALAEELNVPCFSSSSLRFTESILAARTDGVRGCAAFGACPLEPHHPDLFWYGIHGVEILFTVMGPGCKTVSRTQTEGTDLVTGVWDDGRIGTFRGIRDGKKGYGALVFGKQGIHHTKGYGGYDRLVTEIARFFRTGKSPIATTETLEIYAFMAAADESKRHNGAPVRIADMLAAARDDAPR